MPHNLYLHFQLWNISLPPPLPKFKADDSDCEDEGGADEEVASFTERPVEDLKRTEANESRYWSTLKSIIRYNTVDTLIALFLALLINAAILIVSAAAFNARGKLTSNTLKMPQSLWNNGSGRCIHPIWLGTPCRRAKFNGHWNPCRSNRLWRLLTYENGTWLRRIVTRVVAIVPAVLIIYWAGEESINKLLLYPKSSSVSNFPSPSSLSSFSHSHRRNAKVPRQMNLQLSFSHLQIVKNALISLKRQIMALLPVVSKYPPGSLLQSLFLSISSSQSFPFKNK